MRPATRLEKIVQVICVLIAVTVVVIALLMMWDVGDSSRSQGGRYFVAAGALVALGVAESQFVRVLRRQVPLQIGTSDEERRYSALVLLLMFVAAVVLFGFAYLAP